MKKEKRFIPLNIQFFARKKNALTKYFIAEVPTDESTEPDYLRLAKWISTVEDDSDEETEDTAFYDGDGTPESDVMSVKKAYTFEGFFDADDPAHQLIQKLEFETGEGRKIMFKQERTDGTILEGPATVTEPKVTGGEASEYASLGCTIAWDKKPDITQGGDGGGNGGGVEG